jgi:hypothetical protein
VKLYQREARIIVGTLELATSGLFALDFQFAVERTLETEPNTAEIKVWNLSPANRLRLEALGKIPCYIEAGYLGQTSVIFLGDLRRAFTERDGPDLITTIESGDGEEATQTARVNVSIAPGTTNSAIFRAVLGAFGILEGNLASVPVDAQRQLMARGGVVSGSASQVLTRLALGIGVRWSIQSGMAQFTLGAQPIQGTAVFLSADTGLIGTPSIDSKGVLTAKALMIPDIFPGRLLVLQSTTPRLSGNYRVTKTQHTGDTSGDDWYVEVEAKRLGAAA